MNTQTKILVIAFATMLMLSGIASAEEQTTGGSNLIGTTSGVQLTDPVTITLCTKMIPLTTGVGWGICSEDAITKGTFSYELTGEVLNFTAQASGLGGFTADYPEVSDLSLDGATQTTLRWKWTTPDRTYFIGNVINVTTNGISVSGYPTTTFSGPNTAVNEMVLGLQPKTEYTITVQSIYTLQSGTDNVYSLIYYRDTDPNNVNASEKGYKLLDQATSVNGVVAFSGYQELNDNIPMNGDINVRGKIWIVPATERNEDGTLKWTGYGAGKTMFDYLFESDRNTNVTSPADWMGGIKFTDLHPLIS